MSREKIVQGDTRYIAQCRRRDLQLEHENQKLTVAREIDIFRPTWVVTSRSMTISTCSSSASGSRIAGSRDAGFAPSLSSERIGGGEHETHRTAIET